VEEYEYLFYYIQNNIDEKKTLASSQMVAMGIKLIDEYDYFA
jgi:hypothetical protein